MRAKPSRFQESDTEEVPVSAPAFKRNSKNEEDIKGSSLHLFIEELKRKLTESAPRKTYYIQILRVHVKANITDVSLFFESSQPIIIIKQAIDTWKLGFEHLDQALRALSLLPGKILGQEFRVLLIEERPRRPHSRNNHKPRANEGNNEDSHPPHHKS